jgi:hypothetical protein
MKRLLRQRLGAALHDWPVFERNLRGRDAEGGHWTLIGNRRDRIQVGPGGIGAACEGRWTSRLHGCDVFPSLGRRLMDRALEEWPPGFAERPAEGNGSALSAPTAPDVSFVIGHRGLDRLPLLSVVLASIAAQAGAIVECVLVEQSESPAVRDRLPDWVRYLHTPSPAGMPYSRSWAFNVGARAARAPVLAFHDNDMIVPRRYAAELTTIHRRGSEVMNLKRFVFYLDEAATGRVLAGEGISGVPEKVIQNLEGGGSVGVDRDAFFDLGGFDESFVGWGGEDNEFWERAAVRAVWPWGYLPLVHLHHAEQPEKGRRDRRTAALLDERSRIPPGERARELRGRAFGRADGPDPPHRAEGVA